MLFEAKLKVAEYYYRQDWGDVPLKYGELKKAIQSLSETPQPTECNDIFCQMIEKEVHRINK